MNPKVKNFFVIIASALRTIFLPQRSFWGISPLFWGIAYNFDLRYLLQLFLGCTHSGANKGVSEGGCSSGCFWRHIHYSCHLSDFWSLEVILGKVILTFCMKMKTIVCSQSLFALIFTILPCLFYFQISFVLFSAILSLSSTKRGRSYGASLCPDSNFKMKLLSF